MTVDFHFDEMEMKCSVCGGTLDIPSKHKCQRDRKDEFTGGATRNTLPEAYHLIEVDFLRELALALGEGEKSHGAWNWTKSIGDPAYRDATINHLWNHLIKYQRGDRTEPHIGKIAFGLMVLARMDRELSSKKD